MFALYKKEVSSYFKSPFAYIISALFLLVFALGFVNGISNMVTNVFKFSFAEIFYNNYFYFIFMIPLMTMRTFAEERKSHTETLWLSAPITITKVVLAKYLAVATVFFVMMVMSLFFPLVVALKGTVILSGLFCGYVGFFLWGMVCIAIGVMISALCDNPILAAVLGEAAMILVIFLDLFTDSQLITSIPFLHSIFDFFSAKSRFTIFAQGLFGISDLVFFVSLTAVFVIWTIIIVEKRRQSRA